MIVLIIILIVFALILYLPVCLEVKYINGIFSYRVYYAFITFYPKKTKKKKKKDRFQNKKVRKGSKESKGSIPNVENSSIKDIIDKSDLEKTNSLEKQSIDNIKSKKNQEEPKKDKTIINNPDMNFLNVINMVLDIFKAIKINLGGFIKSFRVTDLYLNFKIANQDAYDCALNFGKMNIIVYNALAYLERNFKVKKNSIKIEPKYNSNNSVYDISFKVKLGFGSSIGKILIMIFKVIPILKKNDII